MKIRKKKLRNSAGEIFRRWNVFEETFSHASSSLGTISVNGPIEIVPEGCRDVVATKWIDGELDASELEGEDG